MKDKFGRLISNGDYIVIGMRNGNSGRLGVGIVVEAKEDKVKYVGIRMYGLNEKQKPSWLFNPETILVISNPPEEVFNLLQDCVKV